MLNIDKIREDYVEELKACMDSSRSYYTYRAFEDGNRKDVLSNIQMFFDTGITEKNIILLVSTSVLSDGKSGAVVTTEGVYYLPWSMFGGKSVRFWSHDGIYWIKRLYNIYPEEIFALSEAFSVESLVEIMDQIAIRKTAMKRADVFSYAQILRIIAELSSRMIRITQEYNTENRKLNFYADVFNVLSEVGISSVNLSEESLLGTLERFIQDISQCSSSLNDVRERRLFNTQDKIYRKILCWGIMLSLLVLDACGDEIFFSEIDIIEKIEKLVLDINPVHFPSEIIGLVENIYEDEENDKYLNAVTDMVNGTLKMMWTWDDIGEIELYVACGHVLPGMIVVLQYMKKQCLYILTMAKLEQERNRIWKDTLRNYPNQSTKIAKECIPPCKILRKAQKVFYKYKFPRSVYTVNGASEKNFDFFHRMNCLMGMKCSLLDNTPLMAVAFNQYFLTGISFSERNICWRYLDGSPEMKILGYMQEGLKSGNIFTSNIEKISYVSGIGFTMLEIKTDGRRVFLPISQLPFKNAQTICKYLIKIYNCFGFALPSEEKIELNRETEDNLNAVYFSYYAKDYEYYITHKQTVAKKSDIVFPVISKILVLICIVFGVHSVINGALIKGALWFIGGLVLGSKTPVKKIWKIAVGIVVIVSMIKGISSESEIKTIEDTMTISEVQEDIVEDSSTGESNNEKSIVEEQSIEKSNSSEKALYVSDKKEKEETESEKDIEDEVAKTKVADDVEWLDVYQRINGPAVSIQIISIASDGIIFTASIGGSADSAYVEMDECFAGQTQDAYTYIYDKEDYRMTITLQDNEINISDNLLDCVDLPYPISFKGTYIKRPESDFSICESVFPNSSDTYISLSECEELNEMECKIARNEIYARHGRKFNDEFLQAYFESCSWYNGDVEPEDFSVDVLNDIELENLKIIKEYETERYGN